MNPASTSGMIVDIPRPAGVMAPVRLMPTVTSSSRSEEHTSELQSRLHLVCRLLLEKKFLGRIIDGLTGGNFSVLFGYIADITEPEERGKYFGMVGGASGVGFMVGQAIGGLLANVSIAHLFS